MKKSIRAGLGFGLTSSIITSLGLMVGLQAGTNSKLAVIGGIITIAVADSLSDSLGIHISKEAEDKHSGKEIWEATLSTLFFKFLFASTFIIPLLFFELNTAVVISIIWGLLLLSVFSYIIAKRNKENPWFTIGEHLTIALIVIVSTHFIGLAVDSIFG